MSDDPAQQSVEEELRTGWSRPTARIVLLVTVVLVAVLVFVVVRGLSRSPAGRSAASAPPRTHTASRAGPAEPTSKAPSELSAADAALVAGRGAGFSLVHGRIVYAAELVNATETRLEVDYPIRLPGANPATATVSFAELTAKSEPFSPRQHPPPLTHIAAHQHVSLQIGLHLRCPPLRRPLAWPTGSSTIPIDLDGYPTPAVFTFADLFGFNIRANVHRACVLATR